MKKLLIIALVFIASSFCTPNSGYYATTWAGTAANQGVTYTAMNNLYGIYTQGSGGAYFPWCGGGSIPSNSLRLLTKATFASDYCNVGTYSIYVKNTSKASNGVLVKSDFGFMTEAYNAANSGDCGFSSGFSVIYINYDFTKAYTDAAQTTLFNGGGTGRMLTSVFLSNNYAYCVIDASGNITSLIPSTC